jgi:hypothetical protein
LDRARDETDMKPHLYRFNATLHAMPPGVHPGEEVMLREVALATLKPTIAELYTPFPGTFEQTAARLEKQPRVFFEPDGSFVWGEGADAERWQIDGHLFDRAGRLLYVHLKGTCPADVFDHLLASVGWPRVNVMLQLQQEGYVLNEASFREFAASMF